MTICCGKREGEASERENKSKRASIPPLRRPRTSVPSDVVVVENHLFLPHLLDVHRCFFLYISLCGLGRGSDGPHWEAEERESRRRGPRKALGKKRERRNKRLFFDGRYLISHFCLSRASQKEWASLIFAQRGEKRTTFSLPCGREDDRERGRRAGRRRKKRKRWENRRSLALLLSFFRKWRRARSRASFLTLFRKQKPCQLKKTPPLSDASVLLCDGTKECSGHHCCYCVSTTLPCCRRLDQGGNRRAAARKRQGKRRPYQWQRRRDGDDSDGFSCLRGSRRGRGWCSRHPAQERNGKPDPFAE